MIKDVSIEIVQRCLNRCIHCSSCSTEKSDMIIRLDTVCQIVEGLHELNVERVCLSGGEPFLHPDLTEIVRQISGNQMIADIYTCGVIDDRGKPMSLSVEILSELKKAGLKTLLFNLQSADESTYNLITQSEGHFPLLCKSIANAVACGIRAEIHFVPMKQNINDALDVLRFAEELDVAQVNFLKLVPHGRARENMQDLVADDAEISDLCNRLAALQAQGKAIRLGLPLSVTGSMPPCHAVREKLYIKFDGSVFGCEAFKYIAFWDKHGRPIVPDSIFDRSISEIYQESEFLKRSVALVDGFEHCLVDCENCPVQKYLREQDGAI